MTVWMARRLGPSDYGVLSFATAWMALATVLAPLGLSVVLPGALAERRRRSRVLLASAGAIRVFGAVTTVSVGLAVFLVLRPLDGAGVPVIWWLAVAHLAAAGDLFQWWFQSQEDWRPIVVARQIALWTMVVARSVLLVLDADLLWFAAAVAIEQVVSSAVLVAAFRSSVLPAGQTNVSLGVCTKALVKRGLPAAAAGLAIMVYMRTDQVMIGALLGAPAAGRYAIGIRISEIWYVVPAALAETAIPSIVRLRTRDPDQYRRAISRVAGMGFWLSVFAAGAATAIASPVIRLVFGPGYAPAIGVLRVHIWAAPFVAIGWAFRTWIVAEQQYRLQLFRTTLGAVTNVTLNAMLIPAMGLPGAAAATVAAQAVSAWGTAYLFSSMKPARAAVIRGIVSPDWRAVFYTGGREPRDG